MQEPMLSHKKRIARASKAPLASSASHALGAHWFKTFDALPEGVCLVDRRNRICKANQAFQGLVARTIDSIEGARYLDVLRNSVGIRDLKFWETLDPHDPSVAEIRVGHRFFRISSDPVTSDSGVLIGTMQKVVDVTPSHAAEAGLKNSQARLEMTLRAADMVSREWWLGEGKMTWSGDVATLYNLPSEDLPSSHAAWLSRIHPQDRSRVAAVIQAVSEGGGTYETEFRVPAPGGTWRWLKEKGEVFGDDDHGGSRLVALDLDVTSSRAAADELHRAKLQAEEASLAKSQFLANMSHEIRTPIGAILGFAELLGEATESDTHREEYKRRIQRNGEMLIRLIDDILDLAKVETGRVDLERLPTALAEVIRDVRGNFGLTAARKGIKLAFLTDGAVPACVATDPLRLKQILNNVVGNAVKFTNAGQVTVWIRFAPTSADKGQLTFEVRDTGPGISPEGVDRLFQPFLQADSSMTRRFGGTGLGLALSRRLARLLGGDVTLAATGPDGSAFAVTCACDVVHDPSRPARLLAADDGLDASADGTQLLLDGLNVLVVDDSVDNRMLVGRMLEIAGASVEFAKNGLEGVVKGRDGSVDAILMDMQMPEMDGYEATSLLRREGIAKPIIAITAHAMTDERMRCLGAGCTRYLTKPVNRLDLVATIRDLSYPEAQSPYGAS